MTQELINRGLILTDRGKQLLENAQVTQQDIVLTKFGVGDGASDSFDPTLDELKALTSVPGEWDKRSLEGATDLPTGGTEITGLIPHDVGEGKFLRIFGIYTENDDLLYVFLYPEWQKPASGGNSFYEVPWKVTTGISDTADFSIIVNPSIVTASQEFVANAISSHNISSESHADIRAEIQAVKNSIDNSSKPNHVTELEPAIVLSKLNVIFIHNSFQLPAPLTDCYFDVQVDSSVDLDAADVRFLPPPDESIHALGSRHDDHVRIVKKEHTFKFYRLNGEWYAS